MHVLLSLSNIIASNLTLYLITNDLIFGPILNFIFSAFKLQC
uniref:Uncharacterized protein n=1 Tax=Rhizophora mucronata TaxID=61149 RepID=A0A2P2PCI6_RHIMU